MARKAREDAGVAHSPSGGRPRSQHSRPQAKADFYRWTTPDYRPKRAKIFAFQGRGA